MGSLSDSSDVGAAPKGDIRRYGSSMSGDGRWAVLADGLGVLWTDDADSVQLIGNSPDRVGDAYVIRMKLIDACKRGLSATVAFDVTVRENGAPIIEFGSLAELTV